jgi:NhaP-type Na+/H+ and K+/H+ antiporter
MARKISIFSVAKSQEPLFALSIGLLVFSVTSLLHANEYLAAFSAGVTVVSVRSDLRREFHKFGETLTTLLKLSTLLAFGAVVSPQFLMDISFNGRLFAVVTLLLVRTVTLQLALIGSSLSWKERLIAGWFGPKGFASIIYGILVLQSGAANSHHLFHLIALVIAASIIAHSSTDVALARWYNKKPQ